MAINVSSIQLTSLRQSAPAPAPFLSPSTVNFSRRNINLRKHCSGKLRSNLVKSAVPSAADMVNDVAPKVAERDFFGTPYIPVYVMLPPGTIDMGCNLVNADDLINQLKILKSIGVDGVTVHCWWGIVEKFAPFDYNWRGYRELFQIVRDQKLKLRVVMCFHEYRDIGDNVHIPLPQWVEDIGDKNPDIFFTDREGRRNHECLTWGIDDERVLRARSAVRVYNCFIGEFSYAFNDFFDGEFFAEFEIGLGPCGELRYPSHPVKNGWKYPGIGEFQCYDKYLMKSLMNTDKVRGCPSWGRVPNNAGFYNSKPHETEFFGPDGDYDSYYGRFFLDWYSGALIHHADRVLDNVKTAVRKIPIAAKLPGIHWWYNTGSHAAELAAGFYHKVGRDGYTPIALKLKEHGVTLNFTCVDLPTFDRDENFSEALGDPKQLKWHVQNVAWDVGIQLASENALPCYDREGYSQLVENAKPFDDPFGRHLSSFTYRKLSPCLMEGHNLMEFERFVKKMHGEFVFVPKCC